MKLLQRGCKRLIDSIHDILHLPSDEVKIVPRFHPLAGITLPYREDSIPTQESNGDLKRRGFGYMNLFAAIDMGCEEMNMFICF